MKKRILIFEDGHEAFIQGSINVVHNDANGNTFEPTQAIDITDEVISDKEFKEIVQDPTTEKARELVIDAIVSSEPELTASKEGDILAERTEQLSNTEKATTLEE